MISLSREGGNCKMWKIPSYKISNELKLNTGNANIIKEILDTSEIRCLTKGERGKRKEEEMHEGSPGKSHGKEEGVLIRKLELHPWEQSLKKKSNSTWSFGKAAVMFCLLELNFLLVLANDLTLWVPRVIKINFLLTMSIHYQKKRLWDLIKWSPQGKSFDLLSKTLN